MPAKCRWYRVRARLRDEKRCTLPGVVPIPSSLRVDSWLWLVQRVRSQAQRIACTKNACAFVIGFSVIAAFCHRAECDTDRHSLCEAYTPCAESPALLIVPVNVRSRVA